MWPSTARDVDVVTWARRWIYRRSRSEDGLRRGASGVLAVVIVGCLIPLARPSTVDRRTIDETTVVVAIVGDVLLDRGVRASLERRSLDELLSDVAPSLREADLAVGNLECPLSTRGLRSAKPFSFRGDPVHASSLASAGFDAMSLANNHSLDYGRVALSDTIASLEGAGIAAIGAGPSRASAMRARVIERKGLRIALLGYCAMFVEATTPRTDAVTISEYDLEEFLREIRAARSASDVVIVLPHWGREWSGVPNDTQRRLADQFIEAGATIVAGAHPHVLQPIERRGTSLIAWSLGNFVFDQRGDGADSCVLRVTVGKSGVRGYEVVPVVIRDSAPMRVNGAEAERVSARLNPSRP